METEYFVFIHRPGPAWVPDARVLAQPLEGHFAYMTGLEERGALVVGGGFLDGAGAMGVPRCRSLAEADPLRFETRPSLTGSFSPKYIPGM